MMELTKNKDECNCVYGVIDKSQHYGGSEITEELMFGNVDCPIYTKDGMRVIGLISEYMDKRRNLATVYEYCPRCGCELNQKKFKKELQEADKYNY